MTSSSGSGLVPFTAEWLPTPTDVRNILGPNRAAVADEHRDSEIAALIAAKGGSAAGEFPLNLPQHLWQSAHDYVMYAVASLCEAQWFPEQGNLPDSNRDYFSSMAAVEIGRLRKQLGDPADGGTSEFTGTVGVGLTSVRRLQGQLRRGVWWGRYGGW